MSKVKKVKKDGLSENAFQEPGRGYTESTKAKKIKSPVKDKKAKKDKKKVKTDKPVKVKKVKTDKPVKVKKVKDDAAKDLCKGTKLKGDPCTRKGTHDGFCYQHDPNAKKTEKSKKVKVVKPKLNKTGNPTFKVMIGKAILADSDRKGSSRQAVKKYLSANFNKDNTTLINGAIKKMITSGDIIPNPKHLGHYRMSVSFKKTIESF